jgi:2-dehydropantoate 2-reductase
LKIAVLGMGGIGSTFALRLSRAGHEVTAVARGRRLEQLAQAQAVVTVSGERAPVQVTGELDVTIAYDLVLVTVLAHQVDAVLSRLGQSVAKTVMFTFNIFEPLDRLRDAVGKERFAFGFPAILASLEDGRLRTQVVTRGPQKTMATEARWAQVFTEAGVRTEVMPDMESWLHTHAALAAPIMAVLVLAHRKDAGVSWNEAKLHALAMRDGMQVVAKLGYRLTPKAVGWLGACPAIMAPLLWVLTRVPSIRRGGAAGPGEPRALLSAMAAAAPELRASSMERILPSQLNR